MLRIYGCLVLGLLTACGSTDESRPGTGGAAATGGSAGVGGSGGIGGVAGGGGKPASCVSTDTTFLANLKKKWTPDELVQLAVSHGAVDPPGTKWEYSNTNYVCLGIIVEKVGGKGIAEQIRAGVLEPQKLDATFFDGEEALVGTLAPGFSPTGTDSTYSVDPSGPWAAGSMVATPADTAAFVQALAEGKLLDPAEQTAMETGVPLPGAPASYGLGLLMLDASVTAGAGKAYGHDGSINGYHTQAFHFRDTQTSIVSIVNQDGGDPNDVTLAALKALFP